MHSYRNKRPIFWLRLSALVFPLLILAFMAELAFVVYAFLQLSREALIQSLFGMGGLLCLALLYGIAASKSKCPLCRCGPMSSQRCAKHKYAETVMSSHRLAVVVSVLFLNRFRCPYCGESTRLKVKVK
jgi:hypothetical protein